MAALALSACLPAKAQDATNAPAPEVRSGTLGSATGFQTAIGDLLHFVQPDSSNGLFQASEFDLTPYASVTGGKWGAGVELSYWFTSGMGSALNIDYVGKDVKYVEVMGVARTTFSDGAGIGSLSPFIGLGATHDNAAQSGVFNATGRLGVDWHLPFKRVNTRLWAEMDGYGNNLPPTFRFGIQFAWFRK